MKYTLTLILLLLSVVCLSEDKEYSIDRQTWDKALEKNTSVTIENLYGNVLIKKSYDNLLEINAVNQNIKTKANKAKFIIEENKKHVSIKVVFDNDTVESKERSDLSIAMPKDMDLTLIMDANKLNVKKLMSPLTVKAESTDIYMTTKSKFNILSKYGEVFVKILENSEPQTSSIQTFKGDITLEYLAKKPFIDVISGKIPVSNSAEFLLTKRKVNRSVHFNDQQSKTKVQIKSDTGKIILLDKNI
ncbi:MAG: hypothetical protein AB8B80_10985 [Marinicellaceae bacterium]